MKKKQKLIRLPLSVEKYFTLFSQKEEDQNKWLSLNNILIESGLEPEHILSIYSSFILFGLVDPVNEPHIICSLKKDLIYFEENKNMLPTSYQSLYYTLRYLYSLNKAENNVDHFMVLPTFLVTSLGVDKVDTVIVCDGLKELKSLGFISYTIHFEKPKVIPERLKIKKENIINVIEPKEKKRAIKEAQYHPKPDIKQKPNKTKKEKIMKVEDIDNLTDSELEEELQEMFNKLGLDDEEKEAILNRKIKGKKRSLKEVAKATFVYKQKIAVYYKELLKAFSSIKPEHKYEQPDKAGLILLSRRLLKDRTEELNFKSILEQIIKDDKDFSFSDFYLASRREELYNKYFKGGQ